MGFSFDPESLLLGNLLVTESIASDDRLRRIFRKIGIGLRQTAENKARASNNWLASETARLEENVKTHSALQSSPLSHYSTAFLTRCNSPMALFNPNENAERTNAAAWPLPWTLDFLAVVF
jgi:hypothetical protein